ncbi:MAG TPA: 16S rRNA processing protein RimM [Acidobacteria bacterium]|nr:16S rRNA processing protein RimM [Acidobacteriota bacterium]
MTLAWDSMVSVGRVARAHGNRGCVIIDPDTDFPDERFCAGNTLYVRRGSEVEGLSVSDVRFHRGRPIVAFEEVGTMNDAEALASVDLRVPAGTLGSLPDGSYYHHELIGCDVETVDGATVGVVRAVEGDDGAHRLIVEGEAGEIHLPLVTAICVRVDPAERVITIDPPDGLLALNRTRVARRPD